MISLESGVEVHRYYRGATGRASRATDAANRLRVLLFVIYHIVSEGFGRLALGCYNFYLRIRCATQLLVRFFHVFFRHLWSGNQ